MTTPDTTNKTASRVNQWLAALENAGMVAVMALMIADMPWLKWPIIYQFFKLGMGWVGSYVLKASQTGATFFVIDTQVAGEKNALSQALANLIAAEKSGDHDAIKKAIQAYADANSALTHYDGSAPIH